MLIKFINSYNYKTKLSLQWILIFNNLTSYMIKRSEKFTLLTFYKFVDVENPEIEVKEHWKFCVDIWMKWRIYIWTEWISATVTWNEGQIMAYKLYLANHNFFNNPNDLDLKSSPVEWHMFPKMIVKYREEIVVLWKKYSKEEIEEAWNRMMISELKDLIDNWNIDDYIILDMRNNHEYKLGHFKNAIPANTLNFRQLEEQIEEYKKEFWEKKIITYCTWWIRCEKSTVMLQKAGLKNTYQLDGWVVKYVNTYDDWNWLWNLYVFDDRVSARIWTEKTHTIVWECIYSWIKTDNCENCRYSPCNARIIADSKEFKKHLWFCSLECVEKAKNDYLIKDSHFDKFNYKASRIKIKNNSFLKEELMQELKVHLDKKLEWVVFNHEFSQKEELLID